MDNRIKQYDIALFGRGPLKKRVMLVSVLSILGIIYAFNSDYNLATGSGNLSMVLFLAANVYFPAKRIRLKYAIKNVQSQFNTLLVWHIWLNTFSFVVACIHCYVSMWSNDWLLAALFMMGWLTFGGFLMWFRFQPGKVKKGMYLLHTQQFIFFNMIFAMLKGHYVF
ncbi:MAG: hypothetical protein HQK61_03855 [Desulfamplus sp.]|nr:hypothetical protein [Desulfamplus sp.]